MVWLSLSLCLRWLYNYKSMFNQHQPTISIISMHFITTIFGWLHGFFSFDGMGFPRIPPSLTRPRHAKCSAKAEGDSSAPEPRPPSGCFKRGKTVEARKAKGDLAWTWVDFNGCVLFLDHCCGCCCSFCFSCFLTPSVFRCSFWSFFSLSSTRFLGFNGELMGRGGPAIMFSWWVLLGYFHERLAERGSGTCWKYKGPWAICETLPVKVIRGPSNSTSTCATPYRYFTITLSYIFFRVSLGCLLGLFI